MLDLDEQIQNVADAAFGQTTPVDWRGRTDDSPVATEHRVGRWWMVAAVAALVCVLVGGLVTINSDRATPTAPAGSAPTPTEPPATTTSPSSPPTSTKIDDDPEATNPNTEPVDIDTAAARAAIDATRSVTPIVVARDENIVSDSGDVWEYRVRIAHTTEASAVCAENSGSSEACWVLPWDTWDGPRIVAYGGGPTPVVAVRSQTPFDGIEATLAHGESRTAQAVVTEAGTFAALPFDKSNPPRLVTAHTSDGEVDLDLAGWFKGTTD